MIFSVDNFCTIWSHPKTSTQDFISFDQQLPPGHLYSTTPMCMMLKENTQMENGTRANTLAPK